MLSLQVTEGWFLASFQAGEYIYRKGRSPNAKRTMCVCVGGGSELPRVSPSERRSWIFPPLPFSWQITLWVGRWLWPHVQRHPSLSLWLLLCGLSKLRENGCNTAALFFVAEKRFILRIIEARDFMTWSRAFETCVQTAMRFLRVSVPKHLEVAMMEIAALRSQQAKPWLPLLVSKCQEWPRGMRCRSLSSF